jgi:hypothetical protein
MVHHKTRGRRDRRHVAERACILVLLSVLHRMPPVKQNAAHDRLPERSATMFWPKAGGTRLPSTRVHCQCSAEPVDGPPETWVIVGVRYDMLDDSVHDSA